MTVFLAKLTISFISATSLSIVYNLFSAFGL